MVAVWSPVISPNSEGRRSSKQMSRSLPCCWYFRVHRRRTRPGRRCAALPGACWVGTPGIGWCFCQCKIPRGREHRRIRPAGSSVVPERRPDRLTPPRPRHLSHWWSRSSRCHWCNSEPAHTNASEVSALWHFYFVRPTCSGYKHK